MADEQITTSEEEPGLDPTSESEPESESDNGLTPTPQPTLESLQAQLNRVQANLKGKSTEAAQERQRRESLEMQLRMMQQQAPQPQQQQVAEPTDEELAEELCKATVDMDKSKTATILKRVRSGAVKEAQTIMASMVGQANAQNQMQQSMTRYLQDAGVTQGSALQAKVAEKVRSIQQDIGTYREGSQYAWTGNNLTVITGLAVEQAKAEVTNAKRKVLDKKRDDDAEEAGSEPSGRGNGTPPGKPPVRVGTVYLTAEEKKVALKMYDGSITEREKRYWDALPPSVKAQRQKDGRAS